MTPMIRTACLVLLASAGAAMAQQAETTRQQRMDSAYRNWQQSQGMQGTTAQERGVAGTATPDDGQRPGWTTGSPQGDLKATGRAVKDAARGAGHAVAEGGRKVGRAAKAAGHKASEVIGK